MSNPFETIDARLSNLENLLLDLKHQTLPELLRKKVITSKPKGKQGMEKIILISISMDDLQTLIIDCVNVCLKHHSINDK